MKRLVFPLLGLASASANQPTDKFWQQLTTEERAAAGLDRLTPEQQTELDRLAERFATTGARHAADVAEGQTRREVERQIKEIKEKEAARLGLDDAKRAAEEVVTSRLAGTFRGWSGRTVFHFENGQTWIQDGPKENYTVSPQAGPAVEVRRSSFGGWRMTLVANGRWVWVKRVR